MHPHAAMPGGSHGDINPDAAPCPFRQSSVQVVVENELFDLGFLPRGADNPADVPRNLAAIFTCKDLKSSDRAASACQLGPRPEFQRTGQLTVPSAAAARRWSKYSFGYHDAILNLDGTRPPWSTHARQRKAKPLNHPPQRVAVCYLSWRYPPLPDATLVCGYRKTQEPYANGRQADYRATRISRLQSMHPQNPRSDR